jgi:hypothetical protein
MIIGLDLYDTITELSEFFTVVVAPLVEAGHEIHIISYRKVVTDAAVRAELEGLGIRCTQLHLPTRRCSAPEWKAQLATELGLDLMIEDSPEDA